MLLKMLATVSTDRTSYTYLPHPNTFVTHFGPGTRMIGGLQVSSSLLRLANRAILSLPNLQNLELDVVPSSRRETLSWVFTDLTVPLHGLLISGRCDATLAAFLESQPYITKVCLRHTYIDPDETEPGCSPASPDHLLRVDSVRPHISLHPCDSRPLRTHPPAYVRHWKTSDRSGYCLRAA